MWLKSLSSRARFLVFLVGIFFVAGIIYAFVSKSLVRGAPALLTKNIEAILVGVPTRLKIPSINVDAHIEQVGLTIGGAMDVPKTIGNVAWFSIGPRPGEIGSAVIDGHYGINKNGGSSVFDNLFKLKKGDKLSVEDDKGVITSFVVREIKTFDPSAEASSVFGSSDGKAHLNLITCEGVWNQVSQNYSQRLVVFTDKE